MLAPSDLPSELWNKSGLAGIPDVSIDYNADQIEFPTSIKDMSLGDVSEHLQLFAGVCALDATVMSGVEAKVLYLKELLDDELDEVIVALREEHPKASVKELKSRARNEEIDELTDDLRKAKALQVRLQRLFEAHKICRDTLSRQIEVKRLEAETR